MKLIKKTFKFAGRATRSAVDGLVDGVQSEEGKERRAIYRRQVIIERKMRTLAWMGFISAEAVMFLYFAYQSGFDSDASLFQDNWLMYTIPLVILVCINTASNWISKQL